MSNVLMVNEPRSTIEVKGSPKFKRFFEGLTTENLPELKKYVLGDGTALKVDNGLRTAKQQVDLYKKGRSVDWFLFPKTGILPIGGPDKIKYALNRTDSVVKDKSKVVTYAWVGQTYHNWGLAVDIIFRKYGWNTPNGRQIYIDTGIVDWAKKCGLEWGGYWTDKFGPNGDMAHFQDSDFGLPQFDKSTTVGKKTYWYSDYYSDNMSYEVIAEYNGYTKDKDGSYKPKLSSFLPPLIVLGVGGMLILSDKIKLR